MNNFKECNVYHFLFLAKMFLPTQVFEAKSQDCPAGQELEEPQPGTQMGKMMEGQYSPTGHIPGVHPEIE